MKLKLSGLKAPHKKGGKKWIILLVVIIAAAVAGFFFLKKKKSESGSSEVKTAEVTTQTIVSSLSASGTIQPKDSYNITSMANGDVIEANFEEGDQVTEGQVMYRIDSTSVDSQVNLANSSLERSQKQYDSAKEDYQKMSSKLSGNTYKSTATGYIKSLKVKAGQKISANTEIAELYNDSVMEAAIPFLSTDAQQIAVGSTATLTLSDTLEQLQGTVVAVATMDQTLTGGQIVRDVTIQVSNPGGLTTSHTATAEINGIASCGDAAFTPSRDISINASDLSGDATVESVLVHEGDYVTEGTALFSLNASDVKDILDSYQDKVDSAESSLENAKNNVDTTNDNLDNYTITAPISGTVVTKTSKVGDKIQNGNSTTTMAVIYDLSAVTFQMNIDELDISNVKVGQTVNVTADAFSDKTFTGEVTNVSMEGTTSNGVTYYPVTVTLTDYGDLLPGMNVDGVIVLDSSENAIAIPVDALQRGDVVYVKDSSGSKKAEETTAAESADAKAPDGKDGAEAPASAADSKDGAEAPSGKDEAKGSADAEKVADSRVPEGFHAVKVTTGLSNSSYVEITSGNLSVGDTVYVSQSTVSSESTDMMMGGMGGQGGMGGGPGGGGGGGMGGGPGGGGGGGPMG